MTRAVHVLSHEFSPYRGGIGTYVEETCRAYAACGEGVTLWAPDYGQLVDEDWPFAVKRIRMRGRQDWLCRLRLAKAMRAAFAEGMEGQLILAEPGPIRTWMYADWLGLPAPDRLAVIFHGSELALLSRLPHRRHLLGRLLQRADKVGVVSGEVERRVREIYGNLRLPFVRVPGAVRHVWREEPIPGKERGDVLEVLQVGRIHPRKGQHVLLEAVASLPDGLRRKVRVRLIGPDGNRRYACGVREQIRMANLPVEWGGSCSEEALREAYVRAHVLVMPSVPYRNSVEGLGIALLEAAHFGCAVIGARIGGIPETLREGETGVLFPPGNGHALAAALQRFIEAPDLALAMGVAGGEFVRNAFSWRENVKLLRSTD